MAFKAACSWFRLAWDPFFPSATGVAKAEGRFLLTQAGFSSFSRRGRNAQTSDEKHPRSNAWQQFFPPEDDVF